VLNQNGQELSPAAILSSEESGITLEIFTTQPGLQVYTGQHFPGKGKGKAGFPLRPFCCIALEAHGLPDAPNKPHFPQLFLYPGEIYHQKIVYKTKNG
jgi:aldose 1-epimerase